MKAAEQGRTSVFTFSWVSICLSLSVSIAIEAKSVKDFNARKDPFNPQQVNGVVFLNVCRDRVETHLTSPAHKM